MITEHQLVKVAYIGTFAGIISLFVLVQQMAPDAYTINEIREDMQGRYVNIKCKIHDMFIHDGNIFLTLEDKTGTIKAVVFKNKAEKIGAYKLDTNDSVQIKGKINIYKNELEIIVDDFKVL
ncbi:MAG: OB-fold nucleic acid binding domain-containing protein [Candidatus Aenigmarchaeota archaeon]|nr:OB-fold nucleic acid binding domain-containing protein [Candidatus Aenigmarchaeota archaeon]